MKIKKEIEENIINDYFKTELKIKDIAEKYNLCRHSIRNVVLRNNLVLREKVTTKILNNIILDYNNGITNKEISQKYNLNRGTIQQTLKRNNVKLKNQNETSRKHKLLNENYFSNIDNKEKAYVLGLLFADGYINKNGFGITLKEEDKEILEKISHIIYGKVVLGYRKEKAIKHLNNKTYNSKPQYRLDVVSNIMKEDLIKNGCVKNKTYKIRLPELENKDLYKPFIRGYFDGDGCLCVPKNNNIMFTLTSNVNFCNDIKNYVNEILSINMKSGIRYGDIGYNRLTGALQVIRFMNWLYDDSEIFLKRKFEIFNNYVNNRKK